MKRIFLLIALSGLLTFSCTEDPLQLELPASELVRDTLYATGDETVPIDQILSTFNSSRLSVGSARGYTFKPIMVFSPFPATVDPDSITLVSARIEIDGLTTREGTSLDSFQVTAYTMMSEWNTDTSRTFINYPNQVDFSRPLGSAFVSPGTETALDEDSMEVIIERGIELPINDLTVIDEWIRAQDTASTNTITNNGLVLEFSNAGFIKEVQARDAALSIGPTLIYSYSQDGAVTTDTLLVNRDAYLATGDFVRDESRTQVSTINPWASLYTFDIDSLNRKYGGRILVESANIQLTADLSQTFINDSTGTRLRFAPFISPLNLINKVEVDTSFTGFPFLSDRVIDLTDVGDVDMTQNTVMIQVADGSERRDLAGNFLRRELSSPTDTSAFTGFYLSSFSQSTTLQFYAFYRYDDPDPEKRPRLIVESLILPEERF